MTVTVDLLARDGTVVANGLSGTTARLWEHQKPQDGLGRGQLQITNDHANWPDVVYDDVTDTFADTRVLRWNLDGSPTGFVSVASDVRSRRVGDNHDEEVTQLSGPGGLALLGCNEFKGAVVKGYRNSGYRVFGWPAPAYNDNDWTDTVAGPAQSTTPKFPDGWPDPSSLRLYPEAATAVEGGFAHDAPATWYYRESVNLGTDRRIRFYVWWDNRGDLWFDGEQAARSNDSLYSYSTFEVDADGNHQLAGELYNSPGGETPANTAAIMWTAIEVTSEGELGQVVARSDGGGVWTKNPEEITIGYIMVRLLAAAQALARDALPGITYNFDDDLDSVDAAWSVSVPFVVFNDGEHYADVLRSMLDLFSADADMVVDDGSPATFELKLWDSRGSDVSVTLDDAGTTDAAVAQADVDWVQPGANTFRVGTSGGYAWDPDTARIAAEGQRTEDAATFGKAETEEELAQAVAALKRRTRGGAVQYVKTAGPSGARPYANYTICDTVDVAVVKGGTARGHEVLKITGTVDDENDAVEFDVVAEYSR